MCPDCANASNDGKWITIIQPMNYADIEQELLKRPALNPFHADNRNWEVHESVADLVAENVMLGID